MKKLAVLIALLLALSPVASALTVVDADIQNSQFEWGSYHLAFRLYTDNPDEMGSLPLPAQGTLALVRLVSEGEQITRSDIEAGAGQFLLRDATGAVNEPIEWHMRGTSDNSGTLAPDDPLDGFDLIYYLQPGVSPSGATLLLREEGGNERELLQMPEEGAQLSSSAPEATPAAQETAPVAGSGQEVVDFVNRLLVSEAEKASDPWTRAILQAGAKDVRLQDGALTFMLRSFGLGLKSITETDADGFLRHLYRNASAYDLPCTLAVTDEGGLNAADQAVKALLKAIQKSAVQSKKAFNDKKVRAMLSGYLLGSPAIQVFMSGWTPEQFAPLFAAQIQQALNVSDGPHALKLSTTGAKSEDLLEKGYETALQRLAKQPGANLLSEEEIEPVFLEELAGQASALKRKGAEKIDFVLDIDQLFAQESPYAGDAFSAFVSGYADTYNQKLNDLKVKTSAMPDYPALDFPKSGRVSGSTGGTKVIFKIPKGENAYFLQMRKADTGEVAVTAFVRPGQSATVRVPKGTYYILLAFGEIWYGPEHLFGEGGVYSRTEDVQIKGSNYIHTITLGGVSDGNMSAYGADPSEFQ